MPDSAATDTSSPSDWSANQLASSRWPHLVGVGGTGMNSLATLLAGLGKQVSGSDTGAAETLAWLAQRGIRVHRTHRPEHVDDADLVIHSAAVPSDNCELVAARERGLSVITHARALGALMATRRGIGVAGTHGKSTTTALIAHILAVAGRDPTLVGGAVSLDFGASSHLGRGPELVAEADEYARRFLELHPEIAVITGIEPDHLDYYGSFEQIVGAFTAFVEGLPPDATVITFDDDPTLTELELPRRRIRYGWGSRADWRLRECVSVAEGGSRISVRLPSGEERSYATRLTGRLYAENVVAAMVSADVLAVDDAVIRSALATFRGTRRRFETRLRADGIWIVDDYAHHPSAVRRTLEAAREAQAGPIWAVFQPHTVHRTAALLDEFAAAFSAADHVLVTPIYRPTGRETDAPSVTAGDLVARMDHRDARVVDSLDAALTHLETALTPGTMILTLGAGDVTTLADRLVRQARVPQEAR